MQYMVQEEEAADTLRGLQKQKKRDRDNTAVSRVRLPGWLVTKLQEKDPSVFKKGKGSPGCSSVAFDWLFDVIESSDDKECKNLRASVEALEREKSELLERIVELEQEVDMLKKRTVESARFRGAVSFKREVGIEMDEFDDLLCILEDVLPGDGRVNVFTPSAEKKRRRAIAGGQEEALGVLLKHICLNETFDEISLSQGKDPSWARKIFHSALGACTAPDSVFLCKFLRPSLPVDIWDWICEYDDDTYDFLEEYVPDFDPETVYLPICVDGVHFEGKRIQEFITHLLSYSDKKGGCTVLSVMAGVHTGELIFMSELFGGRTSEPSIVEECDVVDCIVAYCERHDAVPVFLVDKGFSRVKEKVDRLKQEGKRLECFMPIRENGGRQLSASEARFVRDIGRTRQVIEQIFGTLKRECQAVAKYNMVLGKQNAGYAEQQLVTFAVALHNFLVRRRKELSGEVVDMSSVLLSKTMYEDVQRNRPGSVLSGAAKQTFLEIPPIMPHVVSAVLDGHFRDKEKNLRCTNLIEKGASLVTSHHVLGVRFRRLLKDKNKMLLVFVVIGSFRKRVYHCCMELDYSAAGRPEFVARKYCTCRHGEALCIHVGACLLILARFQKANIPKVNGVEGVELRSASELFSFARDELRDHLNWVQLHEFLKKTKLQLVVHPHQLSEKTFVDLKASCKEITAMKILERDRRGALSLGDRLDNMKKGALKSEGEELGVNWEQVLAEFSPRGRATKEWYRHFLLEHMAISHETLAEEAKHQLDVLDVCPCMRGTMRARGQSMFLGNFRPAQYNLDSAVIKCDKCRQWWHKGCVEPGKEKKMKHCQHCADVMQRLQERKHAGTLGFFSNDFEDMFKK